MRDFVLDRASEDYRALRAELLIAEDDLKQQRERVAALRRRLPMSTPVDDYAFTEIDAPIGRSGEQRSVKLSELFTDPAKPLIVIHFMWNPADQSPCPMCTMWADGYDAVAPHLRQNANVVCIAKQSVAEFRDFAASRNWRNLRLVSSGGTTFNRDFGMENEAGNQMPGLSVFLCDADGNLSHTYTTTALIGPDKRRGLDLYSPVWNMLDLLPEGRGEWWPRLSY